MNENARITGILAALFIVLLTLAFIVLVSIFPPGEYQTPDQVVSELKNTMVFPVIPSLLLVILNIPFLVSLFYYAEEQARPFALTGLLFGVAYSVCSGINYFAQLTILPQNIQLGQLTAVSLLSMQMKSSLAFALDNLGYAFLSLCFLFFSGIFTLKGLQGYIKSAFIVYGITGLLGTIGYITGSAFLDTFVLISAFPYLVAVVLMLLNFFRMSKNPGN
jgi:hypothetical protein